MTRRCDGCGVDCQLITDPDGRPTWLVTVTHPGRIKGAPLSADSEFCSECIIKIALLGVRLYPKEARR